MQTKKRISSRTSAREPANPRLLRSQKKASENVQVPQKKTAGFITSSAPKSMAGKKAPSLARCYLADVSLYNSE